MKNKLAYVSITAVPVLLVVIGIVYQEASAQDTSLRERMFPSYPSETVVHEDVSTSGDALQSQIQEPPSSPVDAEVKEANDDVIAYARTLVEKAAQTYINPGWLHISSQKEAFITASNTFPDGTPIPTHSIIDKWILLGTDGNVIEKVTVDDTGDEATTQIVVYQDGYLKNLTFPEVTSSQEKVAIQKNTVDGGFLSSAIRKSGNGVTIHMEEVVINNEKVVVFSYTDEFPSPITFGKAEDSQTIAGKYIKYFFSVDSGVLLIYEDYNVYPNWDVKLRVRKTYTVYEKVDLPPDVILAYLDK
ncbi:MAG: hypothetical protein PVF83_00025 [Anaerolineales bacterium]|jgi:hypothetical protein